MHYLDENFNNRKKVEGAGISHCKHKLWRAAGSETQSQLMSQLGEIMSNGTEY